jgi:hypothetical protein
LSIKEHGSSRLSKDANSLSSAAVELPRPRESCADRGVAQEINRSHFEPVDLLNQTNVIQNAADHYVNCLRFNELRRVFE